MTAALAKKAPFWRQFMSRFLMDHVPSRIKRLIFLSSIIGVIEHVETPDQEMLNKLNTVLKLAHNNEAMALPIHIHSWLWKDCDLESSFNVEGKELNITSIASANLNKSGFLKVAEYLISKAPEWIIYDSEQAIAKDLEIVFKNVPCVNR